ncbi:MAG: hypothetical protein HQL99_06230 [Magnetococcales bacterium]|nr:hypothetical protein [Magnetococcales bacterium]
MKMRLLSCESLFPDPESVMRGSNLDGLDFGEPFRLDLHDLKSFCSNLQIGRIGRSGGIAVAFSGAGLSAGMSEDGMILS